MDIKCNNCKQIYFETTDTYDPDRLPNGGMIDLKPKFKRMGWGPAYPVGKGRSNVLYSALFCPQCGSPVVVKGRLTVVEDASLGISSDIEVAEMPRADWEADPDKIAKSMRDEATGLLTDAIEEQKNTELRDSIVISDNRNVVENTCPDCGKICKTYAGLVNHQRHCKGDE
jgi:hypothetical protein